MPTDSTLLEWITQCEKAEGVEQKQSMMVTLLDKLILYEIFPKVPVIESIANLFSKDLGWSNLYVKMSKRSAYFVWCDIVSLIYAKSCLNI